MIVARDIEIFKLIGAGFLIKHREKVSRAAKAI